MFHSGLGLVYVIRTCVCMKYVLFCVCHAVIMVPFLSLLGFRWAQASSRVHGGVTVPSLDLSPTPRLCSFEGVCVRSVCLCVWGGCVGYQWVGYQCGCEWGIGVWMWVWLSVGVAECWCLLWVKYGNGTCTCSMGPPDLCISVVNDTNLGQALFWESPLFRCVYMYMYVCKLVHLLGIRMFTVLKVWVSSMDCVYVCQLALSTLNVLGMQLTRPWHCSE